MLHFSLPKYQYILTKHDFNIIFSDYPSKPIINKSLYHYLLHVKNLIHNNEYFWNKYLGFAANVVLILSYSSCFLHYLYILILL